MSHNIKAYKEVQPNSIKITVETFEYNGGISETDIFLPAILIDRISDIYVISDKYYLSFDVWDIERLTPPNPPNGSINVYLKFPSEAEAIKWKLKH